MSTILNIWDFSIEGNDALKITITDKPKIQPPNSKEACWSQSIVILLLMKAYFQKLGWEQKNQNMFRLQIPYIHRESFRNPELMYLVSNLIFFGFLQITLKKDIHVRVPKLQLLVFHMNSRESLRCFIFRYIDDCICIETIANYEILFIFTYTNCIIHSVCSLELALY